MKRLHRSIVVWLGFAVAAAASVEGLEGDAATTATTSSVSRYVNTECDISEWAIAQEVVGLPAAAPKVCVPVPGGNANEETERCFYMLIPECAAQQDNDNEDTDLSVTLVVDLHDRGSCPLEQSRTSGWKEFALSDCFVMAWPLGTTDANVADEPCFTVPGGLQVLNGYGLVVGTAPDYGCAHNGKYTAPDRTNDIAFLSAVISNAMDTAASYGVTVNRTTLHVTGYGQGATAALGYAVSNSQTVACVSSFAGSMVTPFPLDYRPLPIFTVLDNAVRHNDVELPADATFPAGTGEYLLPSPSRTDGFFATSNKCGAGTSRSNQATDQVTGNTGLVTGGKFNDSEAPVNFVKPPFASYKARSATSEWPVNRIVDTTGLALLFCRDKTSPQSAYQPDLSITSGTNSINKPLLFTTTALGMVVTTGWLMMAP